MSSVSSEFDFDQPTKEDVDEILKEIDVNSDGIYYLNIFLI